MMMDNNNLQLPQARLLPHGTLMCPVCGEAFPLHSSTPVLVCARCSAKVDIGSRFSAVGAVNPVEEMVAAAKRANELHKQQKQASLAGAGHLHHLTRDGGLGAGAAATIAASKQQKDTRQTEDCLCEKCGVVRKCFTHAAQIRGADEGQTIFYECSHAACGHKWSLNS